MKRWWRLLFPPAPEKVLGAVDLARVRQTVVTLSGHTYVGNLPNVRVEWQGERSALLAFGRRDGEGRWDFWRDGVWEAGRAAPAGGALFAPLWLFTHLSVKEAFAPLKGLALAPVGGQTAANLQDESRALQWLQTTFRVLDGALARCRKTPSDLVVGTLWVGGQNGQAGLRLACFNLDVTAVFREDGGLHVVVFDDKDKGAGSSSTPVLEAEFATLKPAVLDEFIKVAAGVLGAAEERYQ